MDQAVVRNRTAPRWLPPPAQRLGPLIPPPTPMPSAQSVVLALTLALYAGLPATSGAQPGAPATPSAPSALTDRAAVRQAALDYVEALYEVDSTRIMRSVHPDLRKYGYYKRDGSYRGTAMTYEQLRGLATRWNENRKRVDPDSAVKEAVVFEVLDKTASAKVVADWGVDYLHLVREDSTWKIRQVLWQSPLPSD